MQTYFAISQTPKTVSISFQGSLFPYVLLLIRSPCNNHISLSPTRRISNPQPAAMSANLFTFCLVDVGGNPNNHALLPGKPTWASLPLTVTVIYISYSFCMPQVGAVYCPPRQPEKRRLLKSPETRRREILCWRISTLNIRGSRLTITKAEN